MPISDLFPKAGIAFWDVAHETNGGLICDGYTRASGKMAMAIAQNGPGVTGFVTAVKTAYWNHTPRSEEHTSELQSLMRNSYAGIWLKKKKKKRREKDTTQTIK